MSFVRLKGLFMMQELQLHDETSGFRNLFAQSKMYTTVNNHRQSLCRQLRRQ
jgi:hypothetical protein